MKKSSAWKTLEHVPGVYILIGLLFTFIALTAGLSELIYDESSKTIAEGLGAFINALSSKFITSIIGLAIAILFDAVMLRRIRASFHDLHQRTISNINKNFRRLTSQHLLFTMKNSIEEIPDKIEKLFEKSSEGKEYSLVYLQPFVKVSLRQCKVLVQKS